MSEDLKKEIVEILKDLTYWDTCPQRYKDRIPALCSFIMNTLKIKIESWEDQDTFGDKIFLNGKLIEIHGESVESALKAVLKELGYKVVFE